MLPQMALRIGKLLGNGPELWINLQRAYDLSIAERQLAHELKKIPTSTAAREKERAARSGDMRSTPAQHCALGGAVLLLRTDDAIMSRVHGPA
jgi:hypothetical protein